jgi:hypothetical protein
VKVMFYRQKVMLSTIREEPATDLDLASVLLK